jgi:hypothetical protein
VLAGKARPAGGAECLQFADLCQVTERNAAAPRLYAGAFAADPKLADDLRAGHRYNAACSAALAAVGRGTDARRTTARRARLRRQVLDWLRADLALWGRELERNTPRARADVRRALRHWRQGADLAGVRDPAALARLPEAGRADWQKPWADVAALVWQAGDGGTQ